VLRAESRWRLWQALRTLSRLAPLFLLLRFLLRLFPSLLLQLLLLLLLL
jgi:hypothetical protein